jgi:flagellar basal-body rod modification protein FlgD
MTAVSGIGASATKSAVDAKKLANDLDDFMTLLTTQLQHQDPLDPMDATEFTSQLVQFASVEQQIAANSNLETLILAQENSQLASVASYVGRMVEVQSNAVQVYNGQSEFNYVLLDNAKSTIVNIQDMNGNTLFTAEGEVTQGKHGVVWDGTDLNGNKVKDGIYKLTVSSLDEDGAPVDVMTTSLGKVTGVSYADNEPTLLLNNLEVSLAQVITVREAALQLSEVDSIAASALSAAASAKSASSSANNASSSADTAEALAEAYPDSEEIATAAKDAREAATEASTAFSEANQASIDAEEATSSAVASEAASAAQTAANQAATAATKAAEAAKVAEAAAEAAEAAASS